MPHKIWIHQCPPESSSVVWQGREVCQTCGQRGEYAGWGYSRIEAMGVYQRTYGLKPMGPHRDLAGKLFSHMTKRCLTCLGRGLLDIGYGEDYEFCPTCRGSGTLLACEKEIFRQARDKVVEAFPDAEVGVSVLLTGESIWRE